MSTGARTEARAAARTVLVTGAGSGIGRAVAEAFGAAGDRVVVADVNRAAADEVAAGIGEAALAVTMDVTDRASVVAAVAEATERFGPVEVLVNNAGLAGGGGPLIDLPAEVFDLVLAVNLRGTFNVTQVVGRQMADSGRGRAIVNVSSIGARQPTPGLGHYEATKAAVDALTRTAALELAAHGIRVNGVAPGPVHTPMTAPLMDDAAARGAWEARIPLGRIAETGDLTPLVLFLASDQARHITGAVVQVDGGQLLV